MEVEIISKTVDALETICTFGRNCYSEKDIIDLREYYLNEYPDKEQMIKFVRKLIKSKHLTPIETVQINFAIIGVSRALMAQLTRHRIATFCIKSQRYVIEKDQFEYIIPKTVHDNNDLNLLYDYENFMRKVQIFYDKMIKAGIPVEDARFVLPNAASTSIGVSFNLRSLMHFMELRLCSHAQWEIRELAQLMKIEVVKRYPWMDDFLNPACILNGKCLEGKSCGKVNK